MTISGTAATGLALADSAVEVKCAQGAGTATTDANGAYSLVIPDAALPCIVKVTGTERFGADRYPVDALWMRAIRSPWEWPKMSRISRGTVSGSTTRPRTASSRSWFT